MGTRFTVLGTIEARAGDEVLDLGPPKQRRVLAVLLVHAGQVVPVEQIVDAVWHTDRPHRPKETLQTYVARLRPVLGVEIARSSGGYLLDTAPESVDLHRFRALVRQARELPDADAAEPVAQALGLWRGEPFHGAGTPWFVTQRATLVEEHFAARMLRTDIALRCGGHSALVPELIAAVAEHPRDERLAGQLLLALYRDGRQAEALRYYEDLRERLRDELGADPCVELRRLHQQLLISDNAVPRQLPAPPPAFVGRAGERATLDDAVSGVVVVGGPGGVGKTALVLRWAHDRAHLFPDGQLHVNLRGFDPSAPPAQASVVLHGFLGALGVLPERMPDDLDSRSALFRERVSGRRMLVVLDNAWNEDQVRPLLPGGDTCLVVVSSRNRLTGLTVAEQARPVTVPMLAVDEAIALLTQRLGGERLADTEAVHDLIRLTAGLPLALSVVAARALAHPGFPLRALVKELQDERGRLDALDAGEPASSVRAVTSWSYHRLSAPAARLFRLLGVHPGPDIDVTAASALAGAEARPLLAELTRAHVLDEPVPGRFASHDLLRAFARDEASPEEARQALRRVLDHYLHTGFAAERHLSPHWPPIELAAATPSTGSYDEAIEWFTAERAVLLACADLAAREGWDVHAWQLPWVLSTYLTRSGHWDERTATQRAAVAAARRLGDHAALAETLLLLGRGHSVLGDQPRAIDELTEALASFRAVANPVGEGITHFSLSVAHARSGNAVAALEHGRQALALFRATGNRAWEAFSLCAAGWYHAQMGDLDLAVEESLAALRLLEDEGDRDCEAHAQRTLGFVERQRGDVAAAVGHHERARELFHELGDSYSEAVTADWLGDALQAVGRITAAREAWRRAEFLFAELELEEAAAVRVKLAD
ncbi:BTAD domain-containing putative transcriptional regulator [Lentzea sp. CC55]|uniref:AfsR/SARP family transcriptional regulator n=1 Tax=Lentzea sp. CC55 TaxID=2884909 RepID=UPI0027DF727C|nr:BTAD domain-containing putative transcriptional regulator [Lentzea sp. CC55]MCG8927777.1 winged helix-turn-helix domain-containing protein [Lentzea sp. CC55]